MNGGEWVEYLNNFTLSGPDGSYAIEYYGVDFHGVAEETKSFTVYLDNWKFLLNWLQETIDNNLGSDLADKIEDVLEKTEKAYEELNKNPPDYQAVIGNLEGAVGDLEAVVKDSLLDSITGMELMELYAEIARQIAVNAINEAEACGGAQDEIIEAWAYLTEADNLRDLEKFKDALNKYKDALAKAESAQS